MTKKKTPRKKKAPAKPHPAVAELPASYVWNEEKQGPLPKVWLRHPPAVPCEKCKAMRTVHASQAVECYGISGVPPKAYLRCRVCQHRFTMPVKTWQA